MATVPALNLQNISGMTPWRVPPRTRTGWVHEHALRRALGDPAARVWCWLLGARQPDGVVWWGTEKLATATALSTHQVRRARRRLISAGLLEYLGRKPVGRLYGAKTRCAHAAWRVAGVLAMEKTAYAHVPERTAVWVGRAHRERTLAQPKSRLFPPQRKPRFLRGKWGTLEAYKKRDRAEQGKVPTGPISFPKGKESQSAVRGAVVSPGGIFDLINGGTAGGGLTIPAKAPQEGRPSRAEAKAAYEHWMAAGVIPRVEHPRLYLVIPTPPPMPKKASTNSRVKLLVRAYNGATLAEQGSGGYSLPDAVVRDRTRLYWQLAKAQKALAEHEVPPVVWAWWSVMQWKKLREMGRLNSPSEKPPITWVWSTKRINSQHKWCMSEASKGWQERRLLPSGEAVLKQAAAIKTIFLAKWRPSWDRREVAGLLRARGFSGLAELYRQAQAEAVALTARAHRYRDDGLYIWGGALTAPRQPTEA